MSVGFRKFNRPTPKLVVNKESLIIEKIKKGLTFEAVELAITTFEDPKKLVDFLLKYITVTKFTAYKSGLGNLKTALAAYRAGDIKALEIYSENIRINSFGITKFDSLCLSIAAIEKSINIKDAQNAALTTLVNLESFSTDDETLKKAHIKIVIEILDNNFNNKSLRIFYGA